MKERKCLKCGETDPNKFYSTHKTECKKCKLEKAKIKYKGLSEKEKQSYIDKAGVRYKKWVSKNFIHFQLLQAKHRSIRDNRKFELTDEIIMKKLKEQKECCYISNLPISLVPKNPYSLSIDRIDNNKGYTIENTIIVTKFINNCKNTLSIDEFIKCIKEVYNNIKKPQEILEPFEK
jgi:hypothetical protein